VLFRALIPKSLRRIIPTRILCRAYVCVIALEQLMGWLIKVLGAQQSGTNKLRNIAKFLSVEVLPRVGLLLFGGFRLLLSTIVSLYVFCGGLVLKSVRKITRQLVRYHQAAPPQSEDVVFARTADLFRDCMPDREDQLELDDIISNLYILPRWIELFEYYDVVIGYSTDPIWPFLAQKKYFALEHGTLREIPFEANRQGRLTALSYRYAEHAFVTNFDCISNAKILCGDRFSFINHPYDEDHGLAISGVDVLRKDLCRELDADFLVFFPTRQDWVKDTGYADKANDVFIRAFCRLREAGYRIGMVCCDWGRNVAQTKSLLKDHQAARYVRWEEPMGIIRFERMSRACNLVADQFKLGAFGGVTFKALAVGVPVCTFLDGELLHGLYPELPPVINCRDERSIFSELETLMNQPEQLDALSKASRAWIKEHHSGRDVVVAQLRQFKATLENTTGATDSLCAAN
jgi:glycosyltransferase involved in cell wall biosynthesis